MTTVDAIRRYAEKHGIKLEDVELSEVASGDLDGLPEFKELDGELNSK